MDTSDEDQNDITESIEMNHPLYKEMLLELANPVITAKDIILLPFKNEPLPKNIIYTNSNISKD